MKFRRSILAAAGGVAVGAALVTFGFAWSANSTHAQTPSTTPTTSASGSSTPSSTGSSTPASTPTKASSPLTPVGTPTSGAAGAPSLPGTGTGSSADVGSSVLWIGLAVLAAGLGVGAMSLTAKRRGR